METLAEFVKNRLRELDMSQMDLARKSGVCAPIIYSITRGRTLKPSDKTLTSLAGSLEMSYEELKGVCEDALMPSDQQKSFREKIWALCLVLESVTGKSMEEFLKEKLREELYKKVE